MSRCASFALAALLVAGCATASSAPSLADGRTGRIAIATQTFPTGQTTGQPATVTGTLSLPSMADGRVPAVMLMHGCAGERLQSLEWARGVNRMGYAALALDSCTMNIAPKNSPMTMAPPGESWLRSATRQR